MSKTEVIYYYTEEDVNRLARRIAVRMSMEAIALGFILGVFVGLCFDILSGVMGLS